MKKGSAGRIIVGIGLPCAILLGLIAWKDFGPVRAAAPEPVQHIAPLVSQAQPLVIDVAEPVPSVTDCIYWSMPAVDQDEASVHQREPVIDQAPDVVALSVDLGNMGTFDIEASERGIAVTGTDEHRAALMEYEMNACAGHVVLDEGTYDRLMEAAGQPPYSSND